MQFTDFLTKQYIISILALVLLTTLIIPFPTEVVPEWKVLVIDENYLPGGKMNVEQNLVHHYYDYRTVYQGTTDKNGFVTFPKRYMWAGFASRCIALISRLFGMETGITVQIKSPGIKCRGGLIEWKNEEGKILPDKLVCPGK